MSQPISSTAPKTVLAIGGANVDEVMRLSGALFLGASNKARISRTAGGIARNVAQNLAAFHMKVQLFSVVGDDEPGRWLISETADAGVDMSLVIKRTSMVTGRYIAALDPVGDLAVGFADMAAAESLTPEDIDAIGSEIANADHVFADTNLNPATLTALLALTSRVGTPVTIDLVSPHKAMHLDTDLSQIELIVGNRNEATALLSQNGNTGQAVELANAIVARGTRRAVISDGGGTIGWCERASNEGDILCGSFAPLPAEVVDVTGAGDAFHAGIITALAQGNSLEMAVNKGSRIAAIVVSSPDHSLKSGLLNQALNRHMLEMDID